MSRNSRIRHQVLSLLYGSQQLNPNILVLPVSNNRNEFVVQLRHFIGKQQIQKYEQLSITFPKQYPEVPPKIHDTTPETQDPINKIYIQSDLLDAENWKPNTSLRSIIEDIYKFANQYRNSVYEFNKTKTTNNEAAKTRQENPRSTYFLKDLTQNENSETKNLNKHFKTKLKEIYKDSKDALPQQQIQNLEQTFQTVQLGFEQIRRLLKSKCFCQIVKKEMLTGRFMARIMGSILGVKSKKVMVKYFHIMLAAAYDPDSFTCWKISTEGQQQSYEKLQKKDLTNIKVKQYQVKEQQSNEDSAMEQEYENSAM